MRRLLLFLLALGLLVPGCGGSGDRSRRTNGKIRTFASRPDLHATRIVIRHRDSGTAPGYIFIAPKQMNGPGGPMIVDDRGEIVWYKPLRFPVQATDFGVQQYRGRPVLTWWEGTQPTIGIGNGEYVIADTSYRTIATIRAGDGLAGDLHEFRLTPQGTALLTAYQKRPADLSSIGGPKNGWVFDSVVQEVDVATSRVVFEWHSLAHVPPSESPQRVPARNASKKEPFDYFHVNSIDVDRDGNLLVSARNTSAIYKIDRRNGAVIWRFGGTASDFKMGPGTRFAWQHDARRQPDGTITVFDNSAIPKMADHSRALVLRVDERARTVTLVRAYTHPTKLLSPHQGGVQPLGNGDVFVGWGGAPFFTEFSHDGRVLLDAKIAVGDTYRARRYAWSAHPTTTPALRATRDGDDTTVAVSWNGATDVARWRIRAGSDRNDLHTVGEWPKQGFETTIRIHGDDDVVEAEALDAAGRVLRASRPTQARD